MKISLYEVIAGRQLSVSLEVASLSAVDPAALSQASSEASLPQEHFVDQLIVMGLPGLLSLLHQVEDRLALDAVLASCESVMADVEMLKVGGTQPNARVNLHRGVQCPTPIILLPTRPSTQRRCGVRLNELLYDGPRALPRETHRRFCPVPCRSPRPARGGANAASGKALNATL